MEALERVANDALPAELGFEDFETVVLDATSEFGRRTLERQLQKVADSFDRKVLVNGREHRQNERGTARYHSLFGPVDVRRATYRPVRDRSAVSVVPLELACGLAFGSTPRLAFAIAQGHAEVPLRVLERQLGAAHRWAPPRATLDRMARALGTEANEAVKTLEPLVRQAEVVPAAAVGINIGIDRTTIPMEEPHPEDDTKIVVNYRMAYVGTVAITDADCDVISSRRYAAPAHEGPADVIARIMADLRHAIQQRPALNIGVVQDGAPELWGLMRDALRADPQLRRKRWRETIDRFHLKERLSKVVEIMFPGERQRGRRRSLLDTWDRWLDTNDYASTRITKWIEAEAYKRGGIKMWGQAYDLVLRYVCCPALFRYASLRRLGLHEGSGVTEGACKSLITMRAKRSGQRWRERGISAVLALKSIVDSERFPAFWDVFKFRFHQPRTSARRCA